MNDPLWIKMTCDDVTRDAIWQYLVDHGQVKPDGSYQFFLVARNREDFWWRVEQRFNGNYKKRNVEKLEAKSIKNSHSFKGISLRFSQWLRLLAKKIEKW